MRTCISKNRKTGAIGYEIGEDYILVEFINAKGCFLYKYTIRDAGKNAIELMKQLAQTKTGLTTYISQKKPRYSKRWN